jgi:hypothetical protein
LGPKNRHRLVVARVFVSNKPARRDFSAVTPARRSHSEPVSPVLFLPS